jgi:hypothetical protein
MIIRSSLRMAALTAHQPDNHPAIESGFRLPVNHFCVGASLVDVALEFVLTSSGIFAGIGA